MFNKQEMINRFIQYVEIDTQSDSSCLDAPSTKKQFDLLKLLEIQLNELNIECELSEFGVLYGAIPSNLDYEVDPVAFIAHVDTAPDFSGTNIKPQIHENYNGEDILLPNNFVIPVSDFPELKNYIGQTIITSDGTTLLGADDKAGVAEIMEACKYIVNNPSFKHGEVKIAFTPDEEIGLGTVNFDVKKLGAKYGYTLDGSSLGEIQFENFNAASLELKIKGRSVHPGSAKDQMINASEIAIAFDNALERLARPQYTSGYEGFFHLANLVANIEAAHASYIIRDHSMDAFVNKKKLANEIVTKLLTQFPKATIELEIKDTYLNMEEKVMQYPEIVVHAKNSMKKIGITPKVDPVRGGTDGANLSFIGLPCPNLFAGGHNFHGPYEYVPVESMLLASEVMLGIITEIVEN